MNQEMTRQKRIIGDILRVELGDGSHTYARVLGEASYAFYDARTRSEIETSEIVKQPILFIVAVMRYAVTKGHWKRVGNVPLEPALLTLPLKFIQDALDPTQFRIYDNGHIRPATRKECEGLEREAAWDPEHVEERLRDHFAGRPNRLVESMKIR